MCAQWNDIRAEQNMKSRAAGLRLDGSAFLCDLSLGRRLYLQRAERTLMCAGPDGQTAELWYRAEKAMLALTDDRRTRVRLPAAGGVPRIVRLAEWIWDAGEAALSEDRLIALVRAGTAIEPLRYREIWMLPEALRMQAKRVLYEDTRLLIGIEAEKKAAKRYLFEGGLMRQDDAFCETVFRLSSNHPDCAAKAADLRDRLKSSGECVDEKIERAHDREAALQVRLDRVKRILSLTDRVRWEDHMAELSRSEQTLTRDPGHVYPRLREESKKEVRRTVDLLSAKSGISEGEILQKAADLCGGERNGDITRILMTDEGLSKLQDGLLVPKMRRIVRYRDPSGRGIMLGSAFCCLLFWAVFSLNAGWIGSILLIPLCWRMGRQLFNRIALAFSTPKPLMKLQIDELSDEARTLIVLPARIADRKDIQNRMDELAAASALNPDENMEYLLLADLPDATVPHLPEDDILMDAAREAVASLQAQTGRSCWHVLWRERTYAEADGVFRAEERKRGALMALYALLTGASSAFLPMDDAAYLRSRDFRYVITMDAETTPHPDSFLRLIGAMEWPGNRYAVIQPRMAIAMRGKRSAFERLCEPDCGASAYSAAHAELYQDWTGRGIFSGKGIVDISSFREKLEGALPEGRVLSHDLIEGALAGAGYADDICWFESQPSTLKGQMARMGRWIRGDWQLLPFLTDASFPIDGLSRFQMTDNLLSSLFSPSAMALLLHMAWTSSRVSLIAVIFSMLLPLLLNAGALNGARVDAVVAEICILPLRAWVAVDSIVRALFRTYVSGRRLLEWQTASASDAMTGIGRLQGGVGALLLLPAFRFPRLTVAALPLMGLFTLGMEWVRSCQTQTQVPRIEEKDREALMTLAERTWRFFEENVNSDGNELPPDNVQLDPPMGAARRTSPTNIGMYIVSCVAAQSLGLIDPGQCSERIGKTVDTLEMLTKWNGHLYNWYDIDTLQPLTPQYVSSVDSGNLCACLLAASLAVQEESLSARLRRIAECADFSKLYDAKAGLFYIGTDGGEGTGDRPHYDLFASEARILSLTAMALGQIPVGHWPRLGRPMDRIGRGEAMLSWSGTMFEYLMPDLFFDAPEESAWAKASEAAVLAQMAHPVDGLWGVSESGYCAFDVQMNYQYRAFGLSELCVEERPFGEVIAPYASALALKYASKAAARNLMKLMDRGSMTRYGLIEAIDYRSGAGENVLSHMAHHQGMLLCAIANALADGAISGLLTEWTPMRSLSALLMEKPARATGRRLKRECRMRATTDTVSFIRRAAEAADLHLMRGKDSDYAVNARGVGRLRMQGLLVNRYLEDMTKDQDGIGLFGSWNGFSGAIRMDERTEVIFQPGLMIRRRIDERLTLTATECLSPEDGTWIQRIELENQTREPLDVRIVSAFPVALMTLDEMRAHPVFHSLFLTSRRAGRHAICFQRRARGADEDKRLLVHMAHGADRVEWESDAEQFYGRNLSPMSDGVATRPMTGALGHVLQPCSAIAAELRVDPKEKKALHFAIGFMPQNRLADWLSAYETDAAPLRALSYAKAQANTLLGFSGLAPEEYAAAEAAASRLLDPHGSAERSRLQKNALWMHGMSGDRPWIAVRIADEANLMAVRELCRIASFYRMMGIEADMLALVREPDGYRHPIAEQIGDAAAWGGEIHVIDPDHCENADGMYRHAAIRIDASRGNVTGRLAAMAVSEKNQERTWENWRPCPTDERSLRNDNGYGGFDENGDYEIRVQPDRPVPAPWVNIVAGKGIGMAVTERGGGFLWAGNSHDGRLTRFYNQTLLEGWSERILIMDPKSGKRLNALPEFGNPLPFTVTHRATDTLFEAAVEDFRFTVRMGIASKERAKLVVIRTSRPGGLRVRYGIDWLMGTDAGDLPFLSTWAEGGICFAAGVAEGIGWMACISDAHADAAPDGGSIEAQLDGNAAFAIGWSENEEEAAKTVRSLRTKDADAILAEEARSWEDRIEALRVETPDELLDQFVNRQLPKQVFHSRVLGRTGFYQSGGAYGFRDQLQDMLCVMTFDPDMARGHILRCAEHQFEAGDVMHWWHPPFRGVRTRISDDMLFLPYVAAIFAKETGDDSIWNERIPYLADQKIPPDREDVYFDATQTEKAETLYAHCMRAMERAYERGTHGLLKIGGGDWNDGMNRVGRAGRGESVWLTQFLCVVIDGISPYMNREDREKWRKRRGAMIEALETSAWDGKWYLRAFDDEGNPLGGHASQTMQIDCLSQAWAQFAGLSPERVRMALQSVRERLIDDKLEIIRLLKPAFDMHLGDPGYIRAYPPGIRENGGQYTHAACWVLRALAEAGDAEGAWKVLRMLLPYRHSDTRDKAERYRVEPYVLAADIGSEERSAGRGGWTWYTGSAAWLYSVFVEDLLGFKREGNRVRVGALLPDEWNEICVHLRFGASRYHLVSRRGMDGIELDGRINRGDWLEMIDDGKEHEAIFPARDPAHGLPEVGESDIIRS